MAAILQGTVGLDRWVDQYVRGARLSVTENFVYTPEQSFGSLLVTGGDAFEGGLLTFRRSSASEHNGLQWELPSVPRCYLWKVGTYSAFGG